MANETDCVIMIWSEQVFDIMILLLSICIIAAIIHFLFWINLIAYPTVRQRSMQWLYAYLTTDILLLIRFFLLYVYHWSSLCIPNIFHLIICYYEAIFDNYLNLLQSYILLALNICRYLQVARNYNVYRYKYYQIIACHFLFIFYHYYIILLQYYLNNSFYKDQKVMHVIFYSQKIINTRQGSRRVIRPDGPVRPKEIFS